MCIPRHPVISFTRIGETNSIVVMNNRAAVATHTVQYGAVYTFAVLLIVAVVLANMEQYSIQLIMFIIFDQYGTVHHFFNPAVYILAVLLMTAVLLTLYMWVCKGPVEEWVINITTTRQQSMVRNGTVTGTTLEGHQLIPFNHRYSGISHFTLYE